MAALCSRCMAGESLDQPVICIALEGGPCSPCKERASVRHQIKQLEEELTTLKAKHDSLATAINTVHDPFIHKLPPEIGSHIFHLSLPASPPEITSCNFRPASAALSNRAYEKAILKSWGDRNSVILDLGAVCRKWRQLAWATPDLWDTVYLVIGPSMRRSLAQLLPGLLSEWLGRSGGLPLSIFFHHSRLTMLGDEFSDAESDESESTNDVLEVATGLAIGILNSHAGRWCNLHLNASADILGRFSSSIQPKWLLGLELTSDPSVGTLQPKFMVKSVLNPTHLQLINFPLASIDIRRDNVTHATLCLNYFEEGLDFLRRAPSLEYYRVSFYQPSVIRFKNSIIHSRLRSLHLSTLYLITFLAAIELPSLEELTQNMNHQNLPVATMLSFLKRSGCRLKIVHLYNFHRPSEVLSILLQAIPSLERLQLCFDWVFEDTIVMDDFFTRLFRSAPSSIFSDISTNASLGSFLPHLQFMECSAQSSITPFSWDHMVQLYRQGHRRSLILTSDAYHSHITDETALQLLQLADEGVGLQIRDRRIDGDFLESFRNRMRKNSV